MQNRENSRNHSEPDANPAPKRHGSHNQEVDVIVGIGVGVELCSREQYRKYESMSNDERDRRPPEARNDRWPDSWCQPKISISDRRRIGTSLVIHGC
jgi:hypothetical protein